MWHQINTESGFCFHRVSVAHCHASGHIALLAMTPCAVTLRHRLSILVGVALILLPPLPLWHKRKCQVPIFH